VGTGKTPTLSELVYVHYTGTLEDGTVFDSSYSHGRPIKFLVGRGKVIEGWDEGIMSMRVSGVRELVVPPELGYGPMGHGDIPGNAWLHFKCELVSMNTEPSPWTNLRSLMSNTYRVYTGGGLGKK
jgi:peptidylprolyl isomerase